MKVALSVAPSISQPNHSILPSLISSTFSLQRERRKFFGIAVSGSSLCHWTYSNIAQGSSQGRGSRAAAWFQDYIDSHYGAPMQSYILKGGIKGWVGAGEEYVSFVDGYQKEAWAEKI